MEGGMLWLILFAFKGTLGFFIKYKQKTVCTEFESKGIFKF